MKQRYRNALLGLLGAALCLGLAAPALAQDQTSITVIGGSLTVTTPAADDFPGATITGVAQTIDTNLGVFGVSDLRGLGLGWHVTAEATRFASGGETTPDLAAGSLMMSKPTVASPGTLSPDPTIASGPYTIDNGPVEIASAALLAGMGKYDFSATTLTLALPADVFADTYTSTVTITVATGP